MSDEKKHHLQETRDGEPNVRPSALGKPESLKEVLNDVAEGAAHFLEGEPPEGAEDAGHVEGANEE
jgi:hypothetical protein